MNLNKALWLLSAFGGFLFIGGVVATGTLLMSAAEQPAVLTVSSQAPPVEVEVVSPVVSPEELASLKNRIAALEAVAAAGEEVSLEELTSLRIRIAALELGLASGDVTVRARP